MCYTSALTPQFLNPLIQNIIIFLNIFLNAFNFHRDIFTTRLRVADLTIEVSNNLSE